ncbi:MAG: FKBP-type peptidyl-prolyl cis-trans isomerase [Sphaerochaetaceae bacterium]|nr:FKBP-type peptidyl-prolyl cis-trans isomerase [Sphaerochaetaceae bacterium]
MVLILFSSCFNSGTKKVEATQNESKHSDDSISSLEKPMRLVQQFSYVYGNQIAKTLKRNYPEVDLEYLARGVYDAFKEESYFTEEESQDILNRFQRKLYEEADRLLKEKAVKNLLEAESFLSANAKRGNVKSVSDRLQYEILREGKEGGKSPREDSTVVVNYLLKDLSGTVKDSSYVRGEASILNLSQTVKGFSRAVSMMKEGEKVRVWLHPELGYGSLGNTLIGPNELLIFDIELIEVKD